MLVGSRFWLGFDLVLNLRKGGEGRYAFVRTQTESCDQLSNKVRGTWLCIVGEIDLINYSNMGWNLFLKNINSLVTTFFGVKIWIVVTQITQKKKKKEKKR